MREPDKNIIVQKHFGAKWDHPVVGGMLVVSIDLEETGGVGGITEGGKEGGGQKLRGTDLYLIT